MRVGINVFPYSSKSFSGHNPYTRDLIAALVHYGKRHEYYILTSAENDEYFAHTAVNCQTICIPEVLPLNQAVSERHCDLYDCIDSLTLDVLLCPWIDAEWSKISVPSVVIVADILHEYHPEVLSAEEIAWRHAAFRQACGAATQVMCISEFTRKTVLDRFGAEANRVHAVPCAVSTLFNAGEAQTSWGNVKQQFHLEKGYLFLPATTWAHKNHLRLLSALGELKRRGLTPPLVLTGGHKMPEEELMAAAVQAGCADQVRHLGFVERQYMPGLYYGAAAVVFPSVFEGFGLPALEALSLRCPLLCSDIEVFREIVADAALRFDPHDHIQIADAIEKLLRTPELAESLRSRGVVRAADFSWQRIAENSLRVLESTAQMQEIQPAKPFLQGIYPDDWTGPQCFVKRIDRRHWREMLIQGELPAGCNNVTLAVFCDGVCLSALHSQEAVAFSHRVCWPESSEDRPYVDIELSIDRHIVPKELGLSSDPRPLSFHVLGLVLFDEQGNHQVLRGTYDRAKDYALSADSGFTSKLSGRKAQ